MTADFAPMFTFYEKPACIARLAVYRAASGNVP